MTTTITWIGRFITDTCLKSVMGKAKGPYKAEYPAGSSVMIASPDELEKFFKEYKHHNPLTAEQLKFAGIKAVVKEVGFYHGGDELYVLEGISGVWHEQCLYPCEPRRAQ